MIEIARASRERFGMSICVRKSNKLPNSLFVTTSSSSTTEATSASTAASGTTDTSTASGASVSRSGFFTTFGFLTGFTFGSVSTIFSVSGGSLGSFFGQHSGLGLLRLLLHGFGDNFRRESQIITQFSQTFIVELIIRPQPVEIFFDKTLRLQGLQHHHSVQVGDINFLMLQQGGILLDNDDTLGDEVLVKLSSVFLRDEDHL
mmetsp:Transcript_39341/g.44785  ORF Transcript_39341/g.44785 Transcript_39341/m.44785 type:complete len:203 (-) Transcript_39341:56-664(-)